MNRTNKSQFEVFRDTCIGEMTAARIATDKEFATISDIFNQTHNFLATENLTSGNAAPGMESLVDIPKLNVNRTDSFSGISIEKLEMFIDSCKVPQERRFDCALEVARILSGAHVTPSRFYDNGRQSSKLIPMDQLYSSNSIAMLKGDTRKAIESFGEYSDRVTSDSRLAVALTVLRAHKSLIDRVIPRRAVEDPVYLIKIQSPEFYNLEMSQSSKATTRYDAARQPLIELYRDPSGVNTTPQVIVPLKVNDTSTPSGLLSDNVIVAGQLVNLFDLTLNSNVAGFNAVDWTDLVSDGGEVSSILVQVTQTPATGPAVVETYSFSTKYLRSARFVTQTNVNDSGDRGASIRYNVNLTQGSLMANGASSAIFNTFTGVNALLNIRFDAELNIKTSNTVGTGSVAASLSSTLPAIPTPVQTTFGQLTFQIIGWTPYLFFSEENMRKTTGAVRMNYKELEFLIPVGRNFVVDYSLRNQEVGDDVTSVMSEMMNLGNSARAVTIMSDTLTAVNARLNYEAANPDINYYNSVAQDFAAGTMCLPHVYVGTLDVSNTAVMRESERLSDLHSYVTSRLLALIADAHNKSMYTDRFVPGERARYKVLTSGPIAEVLFGITQYWNSLEDQEKMAATENSDYSLKLPNGTILDIVKSNFVQFANTMIIVPVREAKPDDVTSFATTLDFGTYVGQYTPVSNGAANNRIVTNSREILFPTNPIGMLITVTGLSTQLRVLTDGPGIME